MPKDSQLNSWDGGMNQDIANDKLPNNMYRYLYNGSISTDESSNSYNIVNDNGNKKLFVIPEIPKYQTLIRLGDSTQASVPPFLGGFKVRDELGNPIVDIPSTAFTINSSVKEVYEYIISYPSVQDAIDNGYLILEYSEEYGSLFIMYKYDGLLTIANGVPGFNLQTFDLTTREKESSPNILGGGDFNDNYVIFTSNDDGWGQIWYLEYDKVTDTIKNQDPISLELDPFVHLKFAGKLDLQSAYPIRRVISTIVDDKEGNIYWTDSYNPIRTINILSKNSFNVPIPQINLQVPTVYGNLEIFRITSTGSLPSGSSIIFTYRMVSSSGAKTSFAPLSGYLPLSDSNPYNYTGKYAGTDQEEDTLTNKSVDLKFSNLDTSFEYMDIAAVVYKYNNIPELYIEPDVSIPEDGNLMYSFTGNNSIISDPTEVQGLYDIIESANDINVKDNRLIVSGISLSKKNIDWDARAYRFSNGMCKLYKANQTSSSTPEYNFSYNDLKEGNVIIKEDSDCFCPFNSHDFDNTTDLYNRNYLNKVGGSGLNVDYEIIDLELTGIKAPGNTLIENFIATKDLQLNPGTFTGSITLSENEILDFTGELKNYKSPKISAYLKGYQRGEIYRFGIKFFDKKGSPFPVKWIGDIKFPEAYQNDSNEDHKRLRIGKDDITGYDFITQSIDNTDREIKIYPLGVNFTIKNLESIKDEISGFTIVRAQRNEVDKTIMGSGFISNVFLSDSKRYPYPNPTTVYNSPLSSGNADNTCGWFCTPEAHNPSTKFQYNTDDQIIISGYYSSKFSSPIQVGSQNTPGVYTRVAQCTANQINKQRIKYNLKTSKFLNIDDGFFNLNGKDFVQSKGFISNLDGDDDPSGYADLLPQKNLYPITNTGSNTGYYSSSFWSTTSKYCFILNDGETLRDEPYNGNADYTLGIYKRKNLTQYRGFSHDLISETAYIDCSNFISITGNREKEVNVFRGDTTIAPWDVLWNSVFNAFQIGLITEDPDVQTMESMNWISLIFTECSYNLEFRPKERIIYSLDNTLLIPLQGANVDNIWGTKQAGFFDAYIELGVNSNLFQKFESYNYNKAYESSNSIVSYYSENNKSKRTSTNLKSSIWPSEPKILGENIDSWRIFLPNNLYDLDAIYGPINRTEIYNNELLAIQNEAIAVIPVNERIAINNELSTQVVLGTGDVIGKHRYLTVNSGTTQPLSVLNTDGGIYYIDTRLGKLSVVGSNGKNELSVIKGMSTFFNKKFSNTNIIEEFNPLNDYIVSSVHDKKNNKLYFTIKNGPEDINPSTIIFNERLGVFEKFYPEIAKLYISNGSSIITPNNNTGYLSHKGVKGQFYDSEELEPVIISFIINKHVPFNKSFNNLEFNFEPLTLEEDHFGIITVRTFDQTTTGENITKKFKTYRHIIGRDDIDKRSRMQGPWANVEMKFYNYNNIEFSIQNIMSSFDVYNLSAQ